MTATITRSSVRLQGDQLLDVIHNNQTKTGAQLMELCGYADNRDAFNDAVIAARLFNGEYKSPEGIPTVDVELLETLQRNYNLSQADAVELFRKLQDELGIETYNDYEDLIAYSTEEYGWEAEFAQYWTEEVMSVELSDHLSYLVIDWEATWNCNLRYDFDTIEYNDYIIIFHNN